MKKIILSFFCLLIAGTISAQDNTDDGKVVIIKSEFLGISKPLSDFFIENHPTTNSTENKGIREMSDQVNRKAQTFFETNDVDPVVQTEAGLFQAKTLINFDGQYGNVCPPDPTGSAGTSYYVQSVNGSSGTPIKIYNKTTTAVVGTIADLGSLWNSSSVESGGDPIVLYDKFADRWFLSQFDYNLNVTYIAISTTNNPAGTYYTYSFTSPDFPDYQKFSVWQDGYYMTSNQGSQIIWVFQRSVMLTGGTPKAFYKTYTFPHVSGSFFCPLPADADGELPPAGTPCPIFSFEDNGWGTGYVDRININSVTVNWTPATPTATIATQQLASGAFDASYLSSWKDISQYGSSQKLDGIGGVLTFRAQHRVWTGYNSVVVCMSVKTGVGTLRGIRWYELRQTAGVWSIYQQGTYGPNDGLNRWCGSIAMDDDGSIGMAYAVAGSGGTGGNVYPSIRYTGRRAVDVLGTMTFAETTAIAGTAAITTCGVRFGDYSHTSLDPSDGTIFWHTGEYGASGGYRTRIFSFQIPLYVGIEDQPVENIKPEVVVYKSNFNVIIKAINLPSDNEMIVDLFDINGQKINGKTIVPTAKTFETSFNIFGLASGTYLVRVGESNTSFQKVTKFVIE